MAVADYFEAALTLEQQATVIQEFALSLVPGVLQTEGYARAVLRPSVTPGVKRNVTGSSSHGCSEERSFPTQPPHCSVPSWTRRYYAATWEAQRSWRCN